MVFRWRADEGPTLNAGLIGSFVIGQGIRTTIAKKSYIFVIFRVGPDPFPPLWIRTCALKIKRTYWLLVDTCPQAANH